MLYGSKYFSLREFKAFKEEDIAPDLVFGLHMMRAKLQIPFIITSAYRTPEYNQKIGGAIRSTHLPGLFGDCTPGYEGKCRAADVSIVGWTSVQVAEAVHMALAMGMRVGIADTFLHFDVESEPYYREGMWFYSKGENSGT